MITMSYAQRMLTRDAPYLKGHGANEDGYLGFGMVYYALAYMLKAKICVCLGSGGGFVPRLMRQAQRDLNLTASRTILIDDGSGNWGETTVHHMDSFFRTQFPDVEVWKLSTRLAAEKLQDVSIDFLHIDADHSYSVVMGDFYDYLPHMKSDGVITFHDTKTKCGVPKFIQEIRDCAGWDVIDFKEIGAGIAIVKRVPDA